MSDCERQMSGRESGVCVEEGREVSGTHKNRFYMFGSKDGNRVLRVSIFRVKDKGPWLQYKSRSRLGKRDKVILSLFSVHFFWLFGKYTQVVTWHSWTLPSGLNPVLHSVSLPFFTCPTSTLYKTTCSILSTQSRTVSFHILILFSVHQVFFEHLLWSGMCYMLEKMT